MIAFEISVEAGDVGETIEWKEQTPNTYVPTSKLIDKYAAAWEIATADKRLSDGEKTIITFYTAKGNIWSDTDYQVQTEKRWAIIDRAIRIGKVHAKRDGHILMAADIARVVVQIPEKDDKADDQEKR